MLKLFLTAGAQPDLVETSSRRRMALHDDAAGGGHVECVSLLLAAAANRNLVGYLGRTPLFEALACSFFGARQFVDVVGELLQAAAGANC